MDVDFDGHVAALEDLNAGTFFVTRSNEHTMLGISTIYGHDKAAVLFNQAFRPDEPFPCIVTSHYFGGTALIALPAAFLLPALSHVDLQFTSTQQDGPGALKISGDKVIMRVARRAEGFFYLDIKSGSISTSYPAGIEIPRWSIKLPGRNNSVAALFDFAGPQPIS
jgi:hypothetical protein